MAIKEKTTLVRLSANNINNLDKLGYVIPREKNKRGELVMQKNVFIDVFVYDLLSGSNEKLTRICDYCFKEDKNITYKTIVDGRKVSGGLDRCMSCSNFIKNENRRISLPIEKTLGYRFTDISNDWDNIKNGHITPYTITANSNKKFWWKCPHDDGHSYHMSVDKRTSRNQGCPTCASLGQSNGETKIYNHLRSKNIRFKTQHTFDDCKNKYLLRFDFAILKDDGTLIFLIEFDGRQHFEVVNFGGISEDRANENFKITQMNDLKKNEYCLDNNITLYRISYKEEKNIEEILDSIFMKINKGDVL